MNDELIKWEVRGDGATETLFAVVLVHENAAPPVGNGESPLTIALKEWKAEARKLGVDGITRVCLDFSQSNIRICFGSANIEVIMNFRRAFGSEAQLAICGVEPYVLEVLQVTQLDRLFPIFVGENDPLTEWAFAPA